MSTYDQSIRPEHDRPVSSIVAFGETRTVPERVRVAAALIGGLLFAFGAFIRCTCAVATSLPPCY